MRNQDAGAFTISRFDVYRAFTELYVCRFIYQFNVNGKQPPSHTQFGDFTTATQFRVGRLFYYTTSERA
jgi:hypothetical protein